MNKKLINSQIKNSQILVEFSEDMTLLELSAAIRIMLHNGANLAEVSIDEYAKNLLAGFSNLDK